MTDSHAVYSIGAVARMLDVPAGTLRTWEERYAEVVPVRSAGGQRLYSRDQVDQLRFIAAQMVAGASPADAHRALASRAVDGLEFVGDERRSGRRVVIVLAERDQYAANLAEYFLRTEGYEPLIALSIDDTETTIKDQRPLLVIIDLLIDGGEGLALCRRLKADGNIFIVAVSPLATRDQAVDAGADAFLQKPFDPLQLVSTVRDLLGDSAFLRKAPR